jgi:glycosyltransferase involved in cell wall biosynthesis
LDPLVSILVPAYNAAPYLAQTLRSALGQTWPAREVIVVDDGSPDATLEVARSFEPAGVRVLSQANAGAAAARNRALREARGDLIQYLDADDLLAPDKVAVQVRRLREEGDDCVAAGRWARFHDDPAGGSFTPEPFWQDLAPVDWLACCYERHSMMHPAAWLVPRAVAERAGPWDETLSLDDDGEYFCRVVLACRRVLFCQGAVSYYRSGLPTSLSGSRSARAWDSQFRSLEGCTRALLAREDSPRTRRACSRRWHEFVYAVYPDCPELLTRAQGRIAELGPDHFPPMGGRLFRTAARLFGWRAAKRLQLLRGRLRGSAG